MSMNMLQQDKANVNREQLIIYLPTYVYANLPDSYVTIGQAADLLLVDRSTITRWIKRGKLRGQKMGMVTLIFKNDVLALARERSTCVT